MAAQAKADAAAAEAKSDAQHQELKSELANMKDAAEKSANELDAKLAKQLAAQKEELVAKFTQQNNDLSKQISSLESKYDKLAKMIPEDVAKQIEAKLPAIKDSVTKLEQIVANFSPQTVADVKSFTTKYEKEFGIAQDLYKQLMGMVGDGKLSLPKF